MLRDTLIEELLLYLCDNQSLLKAVKKWIGEGGMATLVGAPDVDILAAAIEIIRKRTEAGTATSVLGQSESASMMMMIAFITFNSSLVPLIEGLSSSNPWEFKFSGFRRNRSDDLGINSPSL